jgi:putative ABC transport system substrate-binding protein
VEGQNVATEYRIADRHEGLPALAADLVGANVDVIVALATPATAAAKKATATIPIVMIGPGDPVGSGFIASLARPGGNVTGVTYSAADMGILAKQLELLKEAVPTVTRVAVLSNPSNANHPRWVREVKGAGRSLGVQIDVLEARTPGEVDSAFAGMARERPGAILVMADGVFVVNRTRLAALASKTRLPALGQFREFVEAGGLLSYGPSLPDLGRRAAGYVDRILKGARPADLPVEQPTRLELVINAKAARALGLTIPQRLLLRADHVID